MHWTKHQQSTATGHVCHLANNLTRTLPEFLTHRNCKITNVRCYYKLLNFGHICY